MNIAYSFSCHMLILCTLFIYLHLFYVDISDLPCEITLSDSVDNIVEPSSFMNFMQFSLHYIEKEENSFSIPRFGGHQTLGERETSFHARSQKLHCGFVEGPARFPSTGFDLDEKDKIYMNTCKVVVSSCIFGSSDFLRRPTSKRVHILDRFSIATY